METELKRPFVPPTLTEGTSLLEVTLWSGRHWYHRRRHRRGHWDLDWRDDD